MPDAPRASNEFECDVYELHQRRSEGQTPLVVDVREDKELAIADIGGVRVIQMSTFESRWESELSAHKDEEIIFM